MPETGGRDSRRIESVVGRCAAAVAMEADRKKSSLHGQFFLTAECLFPAGGGGGLLLWPERPLFSQVPFRVPFRSVNIFFSFSVATPTSPVARPAKPSCAPPPAPSPTFFLFLYFRMCMRVCVCVCVCGCVRVRVRSVLALQFFRLMIFECPSHSLYKGFSRTYPLSLVAADGSHVSSKQRAAAVLAAAALGSPHDRAAGDVQGDGARGAEADPEHRLPRRRHRRVPLQPGVEQLLLPGAQPPSAGALRPVLL